MQPPDRPGTTPHDSARRAVGDWQRLSALYEEIEALDDAAAQACLARLEAEGHPLLHSLRQMLAARERVQHSDFLRTPPPLPQTPEPKPLQSWSAGSRVGPYRLQRHLGSGGMAEVWLAERADGAFQRQLALKLLFRHADSTSRDSFAQRFARERDILASLNHPNIAALHDAGVTNDGQPWLALEYVEGESVTRWCDRQALDVRARVQLFRQVLKAVQHAHANLIIHRDIKPGNILVSDRGEVRLLDFGIAKLQEAEGGALAETELTRLSGRPLTVPYASPEQLSGLPLTTACDVYSLGVVFYELLCGERPYELKVESAGRLEQAILEADPKPMSRRALSDMVAAARSTTPKALRRTLAPELDAVVLRMLAKQPGARYGSVESVLADVDRWCQGEPVLARAPSAVYRMRKFVARHPLGVGFGAAAGVSLVVVALVAVLMGLQARQEAARSLAATQFLFDMFRNADPDNSQGIGPAASLLLDKGRQTVLQTMGSQPELQAELLQRIAEVQISRGEYLRAQDSIVEAQRIYQITGQSRNAAASQLIQADALFRLGDFGPARSILGRALEVFPNGSRDATFRANYETLQGNLDRVAGQLPQAREQLQLALADANKAFGADNLQTISILDDLATVEAQTTDFRAAMDHVKEAGYRLGHSLNAQPTDRVNVRSFQASIEQQAGHYGLALSHLESLATDCEAWLDPNSEYCTKVRQRQAVVLLSLGRARDASGLLPVLERQAFNPDSPSRGVEALLTACRVQVLSDTQSSSSDLCERTRRLAESGPEVRQSDSLKLAAYLVMGEVLLHERRFDDALNILAKAEGRTSHGAAVQKRFVARLDLLRGMALLGLLRLDESVKSLQQAVDEQSAATGALHPTTLLMSVHLATALWLSGRRDEARLKLDGAIPLIRESIGAQTPIVVKTMSLSDQVQRSGGVDSRAVDLTDLLV